jgi:hypothetical protein
MYDSRLARFMSVDPLEAKFPFDSPYLFAGNKPINSIDKNGNHEYTVIIIPAPTVANPNAVTVGVQCTMAYSGSAQNDNKYIYEDALGNPIDPPDGLSNQLNQQLNSPNDNWAVSTQCGPNQNVYCFQDVNNGNVTPTRNFTYLPSTITPNAAAGETFQNYTGNAATSTTAAGASLNGRTNFNSPAAGSTNKNVIITIRTGQDNDKIGAIQEQFSKQFPNAKIVVAPEANYKERIETANPALTVNKNDFSVTVSFDNVTTPVLTRNN